MTTDKQQSESADIAYESTLNVPTRDIFEMKNIKK